MDSCETQHNNYYILQTDILQALENLAAPNEFGIENVLAPDLLDTLEATFWKDTLLRETDDIFVHAWQVVCRTLETILGDLAGQFFDVYNLLHKKLSTSNDAEKTEQIQALEKTHEDFLKFCQKVRRAMKNVPAQSTPTSVFLSERAYEVVAKSAVEMNNLYRKWADRLNETFAKFNNDVIKKFGNYLP